MTRNPKARTDDRLLRLIEAALLHRDVQLSRVAATGAALAATRSRHAALEPAPVESADPALHMAALRHDIWAEQCRSALLLALHRQEAQLVRQRAEAARALARYEVLLALDRKMRGQLS
jgi:hypothetical protein